MSTSTPNPLKPRWLEIAEGYIGQHEIPGPKHNEFVIRCHATTTLKAKDDETAWCSSFVNACVTWAGEHGTNSAAAKSWLGWGVPCAPQIGAITVIRHKRTGADKATGSTSGYHVAFWLGQDATHVRLLGGNQGDAVKVSSFALASYEIVGYRWPASALPKAA